ncbi:MAG: DegT/DnrJ/EryC1/StrS family aminotransferase [Phycisphaerales bacterium]|nr:DegT/DnrJ/EryC1/StrS family aminotransferase [Phycisphaerales bacterium]
MSRIPLSHPDLNDKDIRALTRDLVNEPLVGGRMTDQLEEALASRTGQGDAVSAGTYADAARLVLLAMDIHAGDEVILPAFASGTMTQAVMSVGATPVFADCHPRTLNIAPQAIEDCMTADTRAVVATTVFGNPAGLPQLAALCGLLEIPLIEDVAGGLGGTIDGRPAGSFGRAAIIDMGMRSVISCGEGGAICTSDAHMADRCRRLRNGEDLASTRAPGPHTGPLGLRCPLTTPQAGLALPQVNRLNDIMEARSLVAATYTQRLAGVSDVIVPTVDPGTTLGWPEFVIRLDESYGTDDRNEIVQGLDRHEIGAARPWIPPPRRPQVLSRLEPKAVEAGWPVAEFIAQRTVALPMFGTLTDRDVSLVTQTLELMMQRATFRRS